MGNDFSSANEDEDVLAKTVRLRNGPACIVRRELAKGGFGSVFLVEALDGSERFAMKRLRTVGNEQESEALREIRAHELLKNAEYVLYSRYKNANMNR